MCSVDDKKKVLSTLNCLVDNKITTFHFLIICWGILFAFFLNVLTVYQKYCSQYYYTVQV